MITVKSLRAFVNIMDHGSLTAAAAKMNLSQPAVSRLLQQLEEEFGEQLFHRDSKNLTPSREAEGFYPDALRILTSFEEVPELLRNLKSGTVTPFKVICHPRCVPGLVIPALVKMAERYPDLKIDLDIYMRKELGRRIIRDRFDVGVFTLPLQVDIAELKRQRSVDFKVIVPGDHPLANNSIIRPKDLTPFPYISNSQKRGLIACELLDAMLEKHQEELKVTHEVSNAMAALSLVKHGVGYTIADPIALDPFLMQGLKAITFKPKVSLDFGYCLARGAQNHPYTETYLDTLDEVFNEVLERW